VEYQRIIGIDPGYAIVGWGVVEYGGNNFKTLGYGAIRTQAGLPFDLRLESIYDELSAVIEKYSPAEMGLEKLYFAKNTTTAIDVAQARGVITLCARRHGLFLGEYTPLQVKQAVVGYGKAEKNQVMHMTQMLLGLSETPKPDDTADALAIAVCHAHSSFSRFRAAAIRR
jgi:crossover junction endodeoxyribonuclease RuvC